MIKYIILIICILILLYIVFRFKREGFDPLNSNISILDISKNLLVDNSYTFIDLSLNVLHSDIYYPKDLIDINNIVDSIVVDDISYNTAKVNLKNALDNMNNSNMNQLLNLDKVNTNIDLFDNEPRNDINLQIKNTNLTYVWEPTSNTANPPEKYENFKRKYMDLINLRNINLVNPSYSYSSDTYNANEASAKKNMETSLADLKTSRINLYNNGYVSIKLTDNMTDTDKIVLNSLLSINSNISNYSSYLNTFTSKYNTALNPLAPNARNITFSFDTLNIPDISNSLYIQKSYYDGLLLNNYNNVFKPYLNNINSYVSQYMTSSQMINVYNDTDMDYKITTIKSNVDNYYTSTELLNKFNLNVFKLLNAQNSIDPSTNIITYTDVNLNSKIEYSLLKAKQYSQDSNKFSFMANRLHNINLSNNGAYESLYKLITDNYITNKTYLSTIISYINKVNRDITDENSLIESINDVLRQTCPTKLLKTNPYSTYISTSSTDINSYLNNTYINNLTYYGSYSRTNTNITCNESSLQPTINTTTNITNSIRTLLNYISDVNSAIEFYNKALIYNNITTEYNKYLLVKPRLDSMMNVTNAYYAYTTKNSLNYIYSILITKYSDINIAITELKNVFIPCAIKKYATDVYSSRINDYNVKMELYTIAYQKKQIKAFFDYLYLKFETTYYSTINNYYNLYNQYHNQYLNDIKTYDLRYSEYKSALSYLKSQGNNLHKRISNSIQGIYSDTQKYNQKILDKMIEDKNNELTENINNYTRSMNLEKQNAFDYITKTNDLLQKQQDQFNGGNGTDTQLNNYLESINNPFISSDTLRKGTIDRYKDPECGNNEFIYCMGGKIECVDIYGDTIPDTLQDVSTEYTGYTKGKTYGKCGSFIKKINISEYADNMTENLTQPGNIGYFYDLTKCTPNKPWRVGGEGTPISFDTCYENSDRASTAYSAIRKFNSTDFLNKSIVYIESDYILQDYAVRFPDTISVLNNTTAKWFGNQRMYQGVIKTMNKNNLFDIYVPDETGILLVDIEPQKLRLPNISVKSSPKLDNLPKGSHPRPICRYGKFSDKCSKGDDPPIDFKSPEVASKDLELNKYLITPKYQDSKYISGSNTLDDLYSMGTTVANSNNVLGFSVFN
jgi:hypothetical protein